MKTFTIEPHVGPLPLRFGMAPEEVAAILGPDDDQFQDDSGSLSEYRKNVNVGYAPLDNKLREVVFTPGAKLLFRGHQLFEVADPIGLLRKIDPAPQLFVGNVIFFDLGISLTGFHDDDESQKAIAVNAQGDLDEFVDDFVPFQ